MLIYLAMIDTPEGQAKFERLYQEYAKLMYHVAYKILKHHQDAEDAVHQAFIKIAETIDRTDGTICTRTKNYVALIVQNKAIDIYRKRNRHPALEYCDEILGISVELNTDSVLMDCIDCLPARSKAVLLLKHYHGYSSKEVAKILDLSEANVISIDQRAKKALRELCKEEGLL